MRNKIAIKNGLISFICQIIDVVLGFIVRKLFIEYIGIAMLGINGTFTSILSTLSLAELGFESAVIYSLYKPMKENNKEQIEDIVVILKRIYEIVGIFVFVAGSFISLFLQYILKNAEISREIYIVFFLQLLGTTVTYFLAYKRTFVLALQKDYVRNLYMSAFKIIATIIQIVLLIVYHSFAMYAAVSVLQNFATNFALARYVDKTESYSFKKKKINKGILRKLLADVKNIFIGKLAGYIYSSTDNLLISSMVGVVSVGMLGNYTQILYQMKNVVVNVLNSTRPIIGHFLTSDTTKEHSFEILNDYTFIRYAVSVCLFVPGFVLCDCFITAWVGGEYVLSKWISLLLTADIFIHFVHGALVDYISGLGYFRQDRTISIIGACINVILSLTLVQKIGIVGVLIGTVVSQSFFWISRSVVIFRDYFEKNNILLISYWKKCLVYIGSYLGLCALCWTVFKKIPMQDSYFKFIIGGAISESIVIVCILLLFSRTAEFRYVLQLGMNYLKRGKKKRV